MEKGCPHILTEVAGHLASFSAGRKCGREGKLSGSFSVFQPAVGSASGPERSLVERLLQRLLAGGGLSLYLSLGYQDSRRPPFSPLPPPPPSQHCKCCTQKKLRGTLAVRSTWLVKMMRILRGMLSAAFHVYYTFFTFLQLKTNNFSWIQTYMSLEWSIPSIRSASSALVAESGPDEWLDSSSDCSLLESFVPDVK